MGTVPGSVTPGTAYSTWIGQVADAVDDLETTAAGLGTAAEADTGDFATAAQGALADSAVQPSTVDAKGDLLVGTADNTVGRLPAGTDGQTIVYDSGEATGMRAADFPSGGGGDAPPVPVSGRYLSATTMIGNTSDGLTPTIGDEYAMLLWLPSGVTVDAIVSRIWTSQSGTVTRVGLYLDVGGVPDTDVYHDFGTVTNASGGTQVATLGSPVALPSGWCWLSGVQQGSTPTNWIKAGAVQWPRFDATAFPAYTLVAWSRSGSTGALASNTAAWSSVHANNAYGATGEAKLPCVALRVD